MGKKAGLTLEQVIDAAAKIADSEGLQAATLGAVAKRLRIRTPSLYHYFDGLKGLRRELAMHGAANLARQLDSACLGKSGEAALRAIMDAIVAFALRHPGQYAAFLPAPKPGQDDALATALKEPVLLVADVFQELGLPASKTIPAIRAVRALLHGWISLTLGGGFGLSDDVAVSLEFAQDVLISGLKRQIKPRHKR